jgi:hypothetical protein
VAIFNDSGEESPLFERHNQTLSKSNIEQYRLKYCDERTLGYMQAMRDFNHEFKYMLGGGYSHDGQRNSDARVRAALIKLFHSNDQFIHDFLVNYYEKLDLNK